MKLGYVRSLGHIVRKKNPYLYSKWHNFRSILMKDGQEIAIMIVWRSLKLTITKSLGPGKPMLSSRAYTVLQSMVHIELGGYAVVYEILLCFLKDCEF